MPSSRDTRPLIERIYLAPSAMARVRPVIAWLSAIPYARWPQQHPLDAQLRPAMVNDPAWEGFGAQTDEIVAYLMAQRLVRASGELAAYGRMLSVVMPGHAIPEHADEQPAEWATRVHIPLLSNPGATFKQDGVAHQMLVGFAYLVDTRRPHAIRNDGETPRVHFMFDVRRIG